MPERLERPLEEQAGRFLCERSRNRYRDGRLEVPEIVDGYKDGFAPRSRYFARYAKRLAQSADDQKLITAGKAAPAFLERDWTLNDFPSSSRR